MRVKTSITIDEDILHALDKAASRLHKSRSRVVENAACAFLERRARIVSEIHDLEILNTRADALNREMADVLECQSTR